MRRNLKITYLLMTGILCGSGVEAALGQWEIMSPMPTCRYAPAVAVLDGKIYVIGGMQEKGKGIRTVDVYDPATDTWETSAAKLKKKRFFAAAVTYRGRIHVTGGRDEWGDDDDVGGDDDSEHILRSVEVYDPATGKWKIFGEDKNDQENSGDGGLMGGRHGHAAVVFQDRIYVIGGATRTGRDLADIECFNVDSSEWEEVDWQLDKRRPGLGAQAYLDSIFVYGGGVNESSSTNEVFFDALSNTLARPSLPEPRAILASALVGDSIVVAGGRGLEEDTLSSVRAYVPSMAEAGWMEMPPLKVAREGLVLAHVGGFLYAIGGGYPDKQRLGVMTPLDTVERIDMTSTGVAPVPTPKMPPTHVLMKGYPNPFVSSRPGGLFRIRVESPRSVDHFELDILNARGQTVATIERGSLSSGTFEFAWNGRDANGRPASPGLYFSRFRARRMMAVTKILILH